MNKKYKIGFLVVIVLAIVVATGLYLHTTNIEVLNPKGPIARQERNLIILVVSLSLFVVIPVFSALILFSVRYRESNKKHVSYTPDWDSSRKIETLWWLFPTILIAILSVITWRSTEKLTPSRPIASSNPTMLIQVVALDWKWLFLYPDQHIATVNSVTIPKNTPVDFVITADAPMNSFWIPQLGGQIYAMAGMTTQLNLLASQTGNFRGLSANISGDGFSSMDFMAHAKTQQSFDAWVRSAQQNQTDLTMASYNHLVKPSEHVAPFQFGSFTPGLFDTVIMKYMAPTESGSSMRGMSM